MKPRRTFYSRLPARVRLCWCRFRLWQLDRQLLRAQERVEALEYLAGLHSEP